jgi:imidazolonepropionase-like amidohydrolase
MTSARTILRGRVVDGTGAAPIEDGALVVTGDRLDWVGRASELPATAESIDAEVLDFTGCTVLPGLVDAHIHISFGEARSEEELAFHTPVEYRAIRAAWNAGKVLRAGVTSASDAASTYNVAAAVRDAIAAGLVEGPRMAAAGRQLTSHQGLEDAFMSSVPFPEGQAGVLVRSPGDIVEQVRLQVKDGVDLVKVSGSSDVVVSGQPIEGAAFTDDEFALIASEVHRLNRKCTVHARSGESVLGAARAGFDWIMHASFITDEGIDAVLSRDIPIVPVLTLLSNMLTASEGRESRTVELVKRELDAAAENLSRARERGVRIIAGSESGWSLVPYGQWHAKELELLVTHVGMSPLEAIVAGTSAASVTVPQWAHEVGQLTPGYLADVLVVEGDPTRDIRVLQHPSRRRMVMQGGRRIDPDGQRERTMVHPFEKHHMYLDGRLMYDEETGRGLVES